MVGVKKKGPVYADIWDNLCTTLNKNRMSLPFPLDPMEVVAACFPAEFNDLIIKQDTSVQSANFRAMMRPPGTAVSLMPEGTDTVIYVDPGAPSKEDLVNLVIPRKYKNFPKLATWLDKATGLENDIHYYKDRLRAFLDVASTIPMIQASWPELLMFTKLRNADIGCGSRTLNPVTVVNAEVRKKIMLALAKGSLVDKYNVKIWPAFGAVNLGDKP